MVRNKKTIVVLGLLLLGGFCIVGLASQGGSTTPATGGLQNQTSKDVNLPFVGGEPLKTGELFYKMVFAVLVVAVLAIGVMYFLKKLLPKIAKLPAKQIRIVETVSLGQHRNIYLIEVEGRKLLIGGTSETISRLADLSDPIEISEA